MMPDEDLLDFEHLWTTDRTRYVLERLPSGRFVIVERATRSALVIEDDDLLEQVINKMLDAGVEVIDLPPNR